MIGYFMFTRSFAANSDKIATNKQIPAAVEIEQILLGAILFNNESYTEIADILKPEHFYDNINKKIYSLIAELLNSGKSTVDVQLVRQYMSNDVNIGKITIHEYLEHLVNAGVACINVEEYAKVIYEKYLQRQLIKIGQSVISTATDVENLNPVQRQIEEAEQALYNLAENGGDANYIHHISDALTEALQMAASAYKRQGELAGISTGISDIDYRLGGLQKSDLIVLAGRPGMGKTALATNIAFNIANARQTDAEGVSIGGGVVGFFSLEMSSEQLATRIISEQSEIPSYKIRRGALSESDFIKLASCANSLNNLPLYIDHTGGISIAQLSSRARRIKRKYGLDVIIIDYIQLMTAGSNSSLNNRVQEITQITTGLKSLAKELNVPIIALSQLSRQVENRDDKRPQLSDLRESGSIEQDADVVLFVYREEYYVKQKEPTEESPEYLKWQETLAKAQGKAEVIIGKQRHGPTGTIKLAFQSDYTRFSNYLDETKIPEKYNFGSSKPANDSKSPTNPTPN